MEHLIRDLERNGYLRDEKIAKAFRTILRKDFVPKDLIKEASKNMPLPIGDGQTISQPLVVAFMLDLLHPQPGQHILDVGSGSGWTSALLGQIVGENGRVVSIERISRLCNFAKKNIDKYGFVKKGIVFLECADGSEGWEAEAPYDRILVSAFSCEVPEALKRQLKIGGKIVMPIGRSIVLMNKKDANQFEVQEYPGFSFVPLIRK